MKRKDRPFMRVQPSQLKERQLLSKVKQDDEAFYTIADLYGDDVLILAIILLRDRHSGATLMSIASKVMTKVFLQFYEQRQLLEGSENLRDVLADLTLFVVAEMEGVSGPLKASRFKRPGK